MTVVDIKSLPAVQTNLFVKLQIGSSLETFSDYHRSYSFDGDNYVGLGSLLSITDVTNNLRADSAEIAVGISGIPSQNVDLLLQNRIKGSKLEIFRGYFDPKTGIAIAQVPEPLSIFRGVVSNFEISDELEGDTGTVALILTVSNFISLLENKFTGRRTNPTDQELFFPGDKSFDRVPSLANSNFNFGAPVR